MDLLEQLLIKSGFEVIQATGPTGIYNGEPYVINTVKNVGLEKFVEQMKTEQAKVVSLYVVSRMWIRYAIVA